MEEEANEELALERWRFGIEILHSHCMTGYMWGPLRFLWYNPRYRENWKIDAIFNDGVWQVGLGPAVFAYIRD